MRFLGGTKENSGIHFQTTLVLAVEFKNAKHLTEKKSIKAVIQPSDVVYKLLKKLPNRKAEKCDFNRFFI